MDFVLYNLADSTAQPVIQHSFLWREWMSSLIPVIWLGLHQITIALVIGNQDICLQTMPSITPK